MLVHEACPACGRETVVGSGRCEWCNAPLATGEPVATPPPPPGLRGPLVNKAVRRNQTWAVVLDILGALFLIWGISQLVGPWLEGDAVSGILLTPCAMISSLGPFVLAAAAWGTSFGLHRKVRATTRCKACGRALVLIGVRDSNPYNPEEGYTEYLYHCANCGHESTAVDA